MKICHFISRTLQLVKSQKQFNCSYLVSVNAYYCKCEGLRCCKDILLNIVFICEKVTQMRCLVHSELSDVGIVNMGISPQI